MNKLHIIVGGEETTPEVSAGPFAWQGKNTLDITKNYFHAMEDEHARQVALGNRPASSTFQFELHILPGVGHEVGPGGDLVKKQLFNFEARI